jgi:hypothetical protein
MTNLFVVTTYQPDHDPRLEQAIASNYPGDYYAIGRGQWMIAAKATAAQVAEILGILAYGSYLSGSYVICVSEYAGRSRGEMGEWMDAKAPRRWRRLRALFKSRRTPQAVFWRAKRLAMDLLTVFLFALVSFLAAYFLLGGSHGSTPRR